MSIKSITNLSINNDRPWLILGKGPSFSRIVDINTNSYFTFGLNHVVNHIYCDMLHIIDLEVFDDIHTIECTYLIIPWHPHLNNRPTNRDLEDWIDERPYLKHFERNNRLFTYNLSTWKGERLSGFPIIETKYFSAEAAFRILIEAGVKIIYSLGIDGGTKYAEEFDYLKPLTNKRKSFDDQFKEINKIIKKSGITYHALT